MTEELVLLECITDNPYQPRLVDNAEHIESLARSIATDGLLQKPTARNTLESAQLAFGHSRRKAFEWLRLNWKKEGLPDRYSGYSQMPLSIEDLSDEDMYRQAVSENVQRKDLDAIETAKAMLVYRDQFGKNSDEIGGLFGMSGATVRGKLRLLDLPEQAQTKLSVGEISEGTARALLSMQKISSEKDIVETLKRIEKNEDDELPEMIIERAVDNLPNVHEMWSGNREGKPRGGRNSWLLDMKNFPNVRLGLPTADEIATALGLQNNKKKLSIAVAWTNARIVDASFLTNDGFTEQEIGTLQTLINPPTCTACPFYTKVRGSHFCGMKTCHTRKTVAWRTESLYAASKNLGIEVYGGVGPYVLLDGNLQSHKTLYTKRHKDLRLIAREKISGYPHQWGGDFKGIDIDVFFVVATGDLLEKAGSAGSGGKTQGGKKTEKEKAEMRAMRRYRQVRLELVWEYTAAAQSLFEGLPIEVLRKITKWHFVGIDDRIPDEYRHPDTGTAAEKLEYARRDLVWALIVGETSHYSRDELSGYLAGFAEITNVKAPKQLLKRAQEWDADIHELARVAVETAKKKK